MEVTEKGFVVEGRYRYGAVVLSNIELGICCFIL